MKRTTSGQARLRRRVLAFVCVLAAASASALGGAIGADMVAARAAIPSIDGRDVFTVTDDKGKPGDLFLAGSSGSSGSSAAGSSDSGATSGRPLVVTQVEAGKRDIPLDVDVAYSLDGPNVDRTRITGATGVVGVHVRVGEKLLNGLAHDVDSAVSGSGKGGASRSSGDGSGADAPLSSQRFLVVLTVPTRVADDVTVSGGSSIVGAQGSNTLIAAVVRTGERVDCYMNAKRFTMGPIAVVSASDASALAARAKAMGDGSAVFAQPGTANRGRRTGSTSAGSAEGSTDAVASSSGTSSGRYQRLIDQLTTLRDLERALAQREIAEKQAAYDKAFHAYMAAYVGSYTNHLSGSIGSSTQLTALMGTAGELSGDTPLAKAVLGEANATDALASAHQHTGAADAIEQVIRMVRAQGVDGLAETLRRRAGEEETEGAKEYSAGQSQLSQAMIPYSMAYTDTYTKHLSDLTGGTSSGASAYRDQAIAATDKEFAAADSAHAGDVAKVNAALSALAAARERTGAASAYRQIVLRFADDLNGVGAASSAGGSGADGSGSGSASSKSGIDLSSLMVAGRGLESIATTSGIGSSGSSGSSVSVSAGGMSVGSLAARTEIARLRRQAAAERKAASTSSGDVTTTVIDESVAQTDSADVMKFAGGIPGAGKSNGSSKSADAASTSGSSEDGSSDTSDKSGSSAAPAAALTNRPSPYFGMIGMNPGAMLVVDTDELINDTTTLSDAGDLIVAALDQGADKLLPASATAGSSGSSDSSDSAGSAGTAGATSTSGTRFLIVEPGL